MIVALDREYCNRKRNNGSSVCCDICGCTQDFSTIDNILSGAEATNINAYFHSGFLM